MFPTARSKWQLLVMGQRNWRYLTVLLFVFDRYNPKVHGWAEAY